MAISKVLILLIIVLVSLLLIPKSETRSLSVDTHRDGIMKKDVTKTLLRELLQKSEQLMKARNLGDQKDKMEGRYYTNRRSPGGPDPKHHSVNLR